METQLIADETEVVPLLTQMRLPRWVLLEWASKTAGERANVAEYEPPPVAGFETWRWGTRFFREDEELKRLAWRLCERDFVSGIYNDELGIKLVVCTTDANTGTSKSPRNVTEKGAASRKLIYKNASQMKFGFVKDEPKTDLWYCCLHLSEHCISIEVSRPDAEVSGFVTHFSHRIIVAKPGEIPGIRRRVAVPEDFAAVPKPKVTRK